ncbi:hypothetical protein FJT64_000994 [Amphibalanus amphitrite]|uniref:Uncharacterized protein n=1 Tax=Amphibalanus amphitrite TaxID=1232801 RepID=A0A6A4VT41_AMPAM|nr:uncharacterized protein LOC122368291 isoform X1 [Amphibalanus amphitrite]KAF0292481.1 hypothetical protein FJT64_000994 [Amphibalanus amphitrite]KAF0292482.1 hypothetical protein FJT64_000994 [Amphibalanus amphitrite]
MKLSGCLLLAVAAACVVTVHPLPTEPLEQPAAASPSTDENVLPSSSGWGLASLDALAQRINSWMAPVVRAIDDIVRNKTVTEVYLDARNATVEVATRVSESEAVQGAKEAISPLTQLFDQVHDQVKDKTLHQLAGDVQRQIQQLDQSVAQFIRGLGDDRDDQQIVDQIAVEVSQATDDVDPEQAVVAAATAIEQASVEENELEP